MGNLAKRVRSLSPAPVDVENADVDDSADEDIDAGLFGQGVKRRFKK